MLARLSWPWMETFSPRIPEGPASQFRVHRAPLAIQPPVAHQSKQRPPQGTPAGLHGALWLWTSRCFQQHPRCPLSTSQRTHPVPKLAFYFDVGSWGLSGRITEGSIRSANSQELPFGYSLATVTLPPPEVQAVYVAPYPMRRNGRQDCGGYSSQATSNHIQYTP